MYNGRIGRPVNNLQHGTPWFEIADFQDSVKKTMVRLGQQADEEWSVSTETIGPLIAALAPSLVDPEASLKGAELAGLTLQRHGLPLSACSMLIETLASLTIVARQDVPASLIERQRQRLVGHAIDTLDRRYRHELRSALTFGHHDPLTGLLNRRGLVEALTAALQRAQRNHSHIAVSIIDVDALVAQTETHDPRDRERALVGYAHRLDSLTRSTDAVARLGDTSFALLIEGAKDRVEVMAIMERELASLDEMNASIPRDNTVSWHAGMAISPDDGDDALDLLDAAEAALEQALALGPTEGLQLVASPPRSTTPPSKMRAIHSLIARGTDHLEVRYQPIVNLHTGAIARLEALVRLRSPAGIIGPEDFITALSRDERHRVFESVLEQVADHAASRGLSLPISINIEPDLISSDTCAQSIIDRWRERGLDPKQLGVEVIETQDLVSLAYGPLSSLKEAGHHIALDDFGSGYASLSRIMSFPFDEVKLDRAFSEPIDLLNVGLPLMTVAIDASKLLGIELVIEGIEDPRMVPVLDALGAQLGQGYALARPLTIDALLELADPLPLPPSTGGSHELLVAGVQTFRWERAIIAFAASEGGDELARQPCSIEGQLKHVDLIALHRAQHALIGRIMKNHDLPAIDELVSLGAELRLRVSTRLIAN
jgi:diguanylate cyclase (GGDEF)-like protein